LAQLVGLSTCRFQRYAALVIAARRVLKDRISSNRLVRTVLRKAKRSNIRQENHRASNFVLAMFLQSCSVQKSALGLGCVKTILEVLERKIDANGMPLTHERFAQAASGILLLRAAGSFHRFQTVRVKNSGAPEVPSQSAFPKKQTSKLAAACRRSAKGRDPSPPF